MKNKLLSILMLMFIVSSVNAENNKWHSIPTGEYVDGINSAGKFNRIISTIANQLTKNRNFLNISQNKIAITSFVSLNNLDETSVIGRMISENLIHEMQVRGYSIIDFKTMDNIKIEKDGDYIFTREIEKLRKEYFVNFVLSGTLTEYKDGIMVNARIINMKDHSVVSTAQVWISKRLIKRIKGTHSIERVDFIKNYIPKVKKTYKIELTKY